LIADTFDRPNSPAVGEGWVEVEPAGTAVSIAANRLFFAESSDAVNRPLVRRNFSRVDTGTLQWDFDFDWNRTGTEATYRFLMQLGDGSIMSDASQNGGAGVNLIWTSINGTHQSLGYRKAGVNTPLAVVSGPRTISVVADLNARTYSVAVDGAVAGTGIPFDANVSLDTVRFFTDGLNETNFSGRTIDNLSIFLATEANSSPVADAGPDQEVAVGTTVDLDGNGSSDADGDSLTYTWNLISIPAGSTASLTGSATSGPSFLADLAGNFLVELVVNDGTDDSAPDTVAIVVSNTSGEPGPLNLQPLNGQTNVSINPTLEIGCSVPDTASAQYQIAASHDFSTVEYNSGESINDVCSHLAFAGLNPLTSYFWRGRVKNAQGDWSTWSQPTSFTTVEATPIFVNVFQDGNQNGNVEYAGTSDADIRGSALDPEGEPIRQWNQGAQDVLRTGRRLPGQPTDEIYRSLLQFEIEGRLTDPDAVINAYIELTGWHHTDSNHLFHAYNSMYELNRPWGEGASIQDENAGPGEVSWTYTALPDQWAIPGAASASDTDPGADRSETALVQMVATNQDGYKTYWSSKNLVDAVKGWIDDPASNYGVLIKAIDESSQQTLHQASRENPDVSFRPKLAIVSTEELQAPINDAPVALEQSVITGANIPLGLQLGYTDSDGPGPHTFAIVTPPGHGSLTGSGANRTYTPNFDYIGSDSFTWRVNDGQDDSSEAAVSITISETATLLSDTFDRPDNPEVGEGWVELQSTGLATVSITGSNANGNGKLFFDDTSDVPNRPLVRRSFSPVSTGNLQWEFDFDWSRTNPDAGYELWMQLGDSSLMVNPSSTATQSTGVGVNLRWGSFSNVDQSLVARQDATRGGPTALTVISGPTHLSVTADLASRTYSLSVDGALVASGLSFDQLGTVATLDSVRFFTNNLDEQNFSGRTIDNVLVSTAAENNTPPVADAGPDQAVPMGTTVDLDGNASADADGDTLSYFWILTSMPAESTASLTGSATAGPSFVADLAGVYEAELVVNDGTVDSPPDTVSVTAQ
jgi:hypothetical protein